MDDFNKAVNDHPNMDGLYGNFHPYLAIPGNTVVIKIRMLLLICTAYNYKQLLLVLSILCIPLSHPVLVFMALPAS
jgi:hypothetical protein